MAFNSTTALTLLVGSFELYKRGQDTSDPGHFGPALTLLVGSTQTVQTHPNMTYNVFSGMLNVNQPTQSTTDIPETFPIDISLVKKVHPQMPHER